MASSGWLLWGARTLIAMALFGLTGYVVAFGVADYVSKAAVGGLTIATENLQASLNDLSEPVRAIDKDLKEETRRFRDDRQALAEDIAQRTYELQAHLKSRQR